MLDTIQMPEWLRFWEWLTSNGGEQGEVTDANIQAQLNDLDLGNVSTGDICNFFENAYRDAGGHEGGFSYPPAGASPAQAATYYGQHITVDASQAWHFHADDGAVINLGNIGGNVITNPELDVDLGFGKGEDPDYEDEDQDHEQPSDYDDEDQPQDQEQPPDYDDEDQPQDQEQPPDYEDEDQPQDDGGESPWTADTHPITGDPTEGFDPAGLPHDGGTMDAIS